MTTKTKIQPTTETALEMRKRLRLSRHIVSDMTGLSQSQIWRVEQHEMKGDIVPERQAVVKALDTYQREIVKRLEALLGK